ncbi:hypothetical protein DPM19_33685 [Actinomadura craniellae]|uniref:Pentapeptide repeat-containing protein n=2 Tax=Actinomadura craniellae TaxID=2231787 RepID=A0A365GVC3_9ACTN|nr:hypothetical protein DPM19_33685 [Actinomadura craniellae]
MRRALTVAFTGAALLLVAAWFLVPLLVGSPPRKQTELDTAAQLDLLKLIFALVAGIGALVALVTTYRRQRIDEVNAKLAQRVARDNAHDATERRVTDLYGQAVEQLGHDKAAVRLGGLYSLERLAQDHPQHRQTVTDVVCAYLRMPYQPPPPAPTDPQPAEPTSDADGNDRQELQVRLAAQELLYRHLTTPPGHSPPLTYWDNIRINLTGAYLINFDFTHCRTTNATFTHAHFTGDAKFGGVQFNGDARFDRVRFRGDAGFDGAQFNGDTWFEAAQFNGSTGFGGVRFGGDAWFEAAQFNGYAGFGDARFSGYARFVKAQFDGNARFGDARFKGNAGFEAAQFTVGAMFGGARFGRDARFGEAQFSRYAGFGGVRFGGYTGFVKAQFSGYTGFDGAQFNADTEFAGAQFGGYTGFDGAQFSGNVGFSEAQFNGSARFGEARFRVEPDFTQAMASHPDDNHVWPDPWHAEPVSPENTTARLIRHD